MRLCNIYLKRKNCDSQVEVIYAQCLGNIMQRRSVVFKSLRSYSLLVTLFVCIIADVNCDNNSKIAFQFPEFDYKETNKNVSINYSCPLHY